MSKITVSFEGSTKSFAEVIPALSKLLAPAPLAFSIEETEARPVVKRYPKKEASTPAAPAFAPAPAKPVKPAKPAAAVPSEEVTMTSLRAVAMKLPKTKLVPVLEDLGISKLTELAEEDYAKALAALEAANG